MASYDSQNRQVGQVDEANWQLMDFLGPAERWSKMGSEWNLSVRQTRR
jgi:hypothetical protein